MSLLDDVSIVVTPNGYKAGELYAVIPVPSEGSELVTNGDFATDSDWTKTSGWTISGGSGNCDGTNSASIKQTISALTIGKYYTFTFDISNYTSGTTTIYLPFGAANLGSFSGNGTHTITAIISSTPTKDVYFKSNSFTGSIDNVSVKEYTAADMDVTRATAATRVDEAGLVNYAEIVGSEEVVNGDYTNGLTGWSTQIPSGQTVEVTSNQLHINYDSTATQGSTGVNQTILTAGKQYKITIDVASITGTFRVQAGGQVQDINTSGIHTFYKTPTSSILYIIRQSNSASCEFRLNSVSVKEVTRDNVPRIDYAGCPHILAEPQRTNLLPYSEDLSEWNFISGGAVDTINYRTSPDGTLNSTRLVFSSDNLQYSNTLTTGSSTVGSIYMKGVSGETIAFGMQSSESLFTFDGTWQRFEKTGTATSNKITINTYGGATARDFEVWGGQVEAGSYATSYIPTSGSTVTRNKDQFTRDGIGSLINSTEGVLFVEMAFLSETDPSLQRLTINDGTGNNRVIIQANPNGNVMQFYLITNSVAVASFYYTLANKTNFNKIAFKWKVNDFAVWSNGTEVLTDTFGATFSSGTLNRITFEGVTGGNNLYGKVKQLQVYKTALTDAQLAALTS